MRIARRPKSRFILAALLLCALVASTASASNSGQLSSFGTRGTGPGKLRVPTLFGFDSADKSLFVADFAEDFSAVRVQKFSAGGSALGSVSLDRAGENEERNFQGIAVDPNAGRIYLLQYKPGADTENGEPAAQKILVFSTTPNGAGQLVPPAAGPATLPVPDPGGAEALDNPKTLTLDPQSGNLVIAAENRQHQYVLQRITTTGNGAVGPRYTETTSSTPLNQTTGESGRNASDVIGPDGTIYIFIRGVSNEGAQGEGVDRLFTLPANFAGRPVEEPGLAAASSEAGSEGKLTEIEQPFQGITGNGPQIALSADAGTLYWKEIRSDSGGQTAGNYLIRGYSFADRLTSTTYGLGAVGQCRVQSKQAALVADGGEGLYVLDQGPQSLEPGEEPTYGPKVFHYGPGGSGCPTPSASLKLRVGTTEVANVPSGTKLTLDGSATELGSLGVTLEKATFRIEGPGAPFEETVNVTETSKLKLEHTFSTAGEYTVHLAIKTKGGQAPLLDEKIAAQPRKLTVGSGTGSAPTVTAVEPASGPAAGGTTVTITGTNLTGVTEVDFGASAATEVNVVDPGHLTARSPAGAGIVDVVVLNESGASATTAADQFTYEGGGGGGEATAPTVTAVTPGHGPAAGGTTVEIIGTELTGAGAVRFGAAAASLVTPVSPTKVIARAPAGVAGATVDVTVTTPVGTSAPSGGDRFTYELGGLALSLVLQKAGSGQGTVSSSPAGISCGVTCGALFPEGTVVTLYVSPVNGSVFAGWAGACSGTGSCVVPVTAATTVTATFDAATKVATPTPRRAAPAPAKPAPTKPLKCRKGFAKKKVHGHLKCVKVTRHQPSHRQKHSKHKRAHKSLVSSSSP